MRSLAIVLSLLVQGACAGPAAVRGGGGTSADPDCPDEVPCAAGGGGTGELGTQLLYGIGIAALGTGVGALIYRIARSAPFPSLRATASAATPTALPSTSLPRR
jgi:hypothetical protein